MATKQAFIGSACESYVAMRLCQNSLIPFRPLIDGASSDIIAESETGKVYRLQIKSIVFKDKNRVRLERSGSSGVRAGIHRVYTKADVDFVVIVNLPKGTSYIIPATGRRNIGLKDMEAYRENWGQLE